MSACAGEFKSQRVHCAGAQAPKSTKPEAIPQSAGAGVWGATSRRQFRLSGRRKSGYYFKFERAVAQSGSALPWGGRGPGFKSRRPDNLKAGRRVQVKGGKTISRSASSTFHLPPYTQAKRQGYKVLERMVLKRVLDEMGRLENAMKKRSVKRGRKFVWDALIYKKCTEPLVQVSS